MLAPESLTRFVGRTVNVFGARYNTEDELVVIEVGHLVAVEPGCLVLADKEGEAPSQVIDLGIVGLVVLRAPETPTPKALPGGKVHRMKAVEAPEGEPG